MLNLMSNAIFLVMYLTVWDISTVQRTGLIGGECFNSCFLDGLKPPDRPTELHTIISIVLDTNIPLPWFGAFVLGELIMVHNGSEIATLIMVNAGCNMCENWLFRSASVKAFVLETMGSGVIWRPCLWSCNGGRDRRGRLLNFSFEKAAVQSFTGLVDEKTAGNPAFNHRL